MTEPVRELSKITGRYQTTVPKGVREQLKLREGDQIRYCIEANGRIYIEACIATDKAAEGQAEEIDPTVGHFLDFLDKDMNEHPERLTLFDHSMHSRINELIESVEVDLDAELNPDDE